MSPMESEKITRKTRIDGRLRDAGWAIKAFKPDDDTAKHKHHAIEELPTVNGPADYGLFELGEPLGIVEAKKVTVG